MNIMQLLDPNLFVDRVSVIEEDDSVEPPILKVFPDVPDLVSDDIWDAFDFSEDVSDFSLTVDEFNEGALPDEMSRLVESDSELPNDGKDISSLPDDSAMSGTADGAPVEAANIYNNPVDFSMAWWITNMRYDVFLALLFRNLMEFEPSSEARLQ